MKKSLLFLWMVCIIGTANAQWININNGLPDFPPTSMVNWVDTMVVSTYGGGMYLTYDQGENWQEMPGELPNQFINKIHYQGMQFDPIYVSTDAGPFISVNGSYIDCSGDGLDNTEISCFTLGNEGISKDALVGTKSAGAFAADYTSPFIYDWSLATPDFSGDELKINDALVGNNLSFLLTDGGFFRAMDNEMQWTATNNGLSGDALKVNSLSYLGTVVIIGTDGGLYYTLDFNTDWAVALANEKVDIVFYTPTELSSTGFWVFALGENGFYTEDLVSWTEMDFGGIQGRVSAAQYDDEYLYLGFTIDGKSTQESGGLYKKTFDEFVLGTDETNLKKLPVLSQNFPNPTYGITQINYTLHKADFITLNLYDFTGRLIETHINQYEEKGSHVISIATQHLPSGVYTYALQGRTNLSEVKKMLVVKH